MPTTCNVCYAWQPKEWVGWQYVDTVAKCSRKDRFTTQNETCEYASITEPRRNKDVPQHRSSEVVSIQPTTFELYAHQKEAIDYFDTKTEIALFFEMGVGKSATVLKIAENKFKRKEIDALLIVAPNDVHLQ